MNCMERLQAYLRENNGPFQVQHQPITYSAHDVAASEHDPGKMMAQPVVVFAGGETVMLALPGSHRVDVEKAAAVLGAKEVRLAHEPELAVYFPDCEVGAMPPFGNLYDVPVWVDRSLAEDETIVFRAGTHTDTMSLKYDDYARLAKPNVAQFAVHL